MFIIFYYNTNLTHHLWLLNHLYEKLEGNFCDVRHSIIDLDHKKT